MARFRALKILILDARHPGLRQDVDAMFEAFRTLRDVKEMILTKYGEHAGLDCVWNYKKQRWRVQQEQMQKIQAAMTAFQELVSEERN